MEQAQQEKVYMERLPLVAMQIRSALGNIYYGMQKLAPADERDEDPILDANAAMLYHGYFRLLRLAKNLESASMLNRKELLPTENTDLKVWLDEIIREAEVPFELKGVQLEMVCEERYAITAVNEPWLSQALWQLLSNALKACSAGGKVTVTLAVQKPHVLIKVKDTGCGIPADRQEMLFRWHMRPMTLDYVAGGVGLGLPLAHQIARLHGGQLLLKNIIPKHMDCISAKLMEMGVSVTEDDDSLLVRRSGPLTKTNVKTLPYPGFPTDMQPQITAVLALAEGTSLVTEGVYGANRFKYVDELKRLGAHIQVDGKVAVVEGVKQLVGAPIQACDLRAGAALVIAGLAAQGTTELSHINYIERGYEDLVGKLRAVGADISLVDVPDEADTETHAG